MNTQDIPEKIWYADPRGFLTRDNFLAIVPTGSMTYAQQLNAVMRFSFFYAAAVAAVRMRPESFVLPLAVALITYLLYEGSGGARGQALRAAAAAESMAAFSSDGSPIAGGDFGDGDPWDGNGGSCLRPTKHNPFMNQLPLDPTPFEPPSCDPLHPAVKRLMREKFQRDLFRDTSDLFERGNSERQFFTMPSNMPEDQTAFAEWVYGDTRRGGKATKPPP